jgi:Ca-activated chloride channel homolog
VRLAEPFALVFALLAPLALLAFWGIEKRRTHLVDRAGDRTLIVAMSGLGPEHGRTLRAIEAILWSLALLLVSIALARPQLGSRTELRTGRGMDVVVALDLSRSMLARDVAPSRLDRAKLELTTLIDDLAGDRIGFVGFTSVALPLCPLTIDHSALLLQMKEAKPDDLPRGGTAIADAIRAGKKMIDQSRYRSSGKAIIIVTDGEEHEGDPQAAAEEAKAAGIEVHMVGIGSVAGEPIPVGGGYLKDAAGQTVISRLNTTLLEEVASAGGGLSVLPGPSGGVDLSLIRSRLRALKKEELEQREVRIYEERYRWALWPAFVLLVVASLIRRWRPRRTMLAASIAVLAPILLGAGPLEREHPEVKRGNEALGNGDGKTAIDAYQRAESDVGRDPRFFFNRGLAKAAAGEIDQALEDYKSALAASSDPALRAQAAYAMGNAYRGLKKWDEAITSYRQSLIDDPAHQGARRNLELASALKRIAALQPKPPGGDGEPPPPSQDGGVPDADSRDSGSNDGGGSGDGGGEQDGGGNSSGQDGGVGQDGGQNSGGKDAGSEKDGGAGSNTQEPKPEQLDQQDVQQILDSLEAQEKAIKNKRLLETVRPGKVDKDW